MQSMGLDRLVPVSRVEVSFKHDDRRGFALGSHPAGARRYGVRRAGVFGSYARSDATAESDLDLLVDLPDGSSLLDLVGLQLDLSEALGIEVDANTYNAIHPLLRERILADEIRIL